MNKNLFEGQIKQMSLNSSPNVPYQYNPECILTDKAHCLQTFQGDNYLSA